MILITGGAGFIGSHFIHQWLASHDEGIINLDILSYAGNVENLSAIAGDPRYHFVHGDIADQALVSELLKQHRVRALWHLAAESHVDRSIDSPQAFLSSNVMGTFYLLEAVRSYWQTLPEQEKKDFRFIHVSTDEVFGSLAQDEPAFSEQSNYQPNSPYSASKAASDHLARAWFHTYGLPVVITHCSNNYGPYQFPEKLIPLIIHRALRHEPLPVYGDGLQVRDWLYVADHAQALMDIGARAQPGSHYNIGGMNEKTNLEVVHQLCDVLDRLAPSQQLTSYRQLIRFVSDRPGHDRRYAIDSRKLSTELGFYPTQSFATGLEKTVQWYLDNSVWVEHVTSGSYRSWMTQQYQS